MIRLLAVSGGLMLAIALLAPAAAWIADARLSRDVILITPAAPEIVELNKAMWSKGEPVPPLYGEAVDRPIRVVLPDPRDVIVPDEDPSLALMNAGGPRRPLQVRTVWVVSRYGGIAGGVTGCALLAAAAALRRRRASRSPRNGSGTGEGA